jgi:hypothetical protein
VYRTDSDLAETSEEVLGDINRVLELLGSDIGRRHGQVKVEAYKGRKVKGREVEKMRRTKAKQASFYKAKERADQPDDT